MGTINKNIQRYDVTAVYTHPQAKVDIILIHGLNGNPTKTWTAGNGVYWPTDLLPKTLEEDGTQANIFVYGYNADVAGNKDKKPSTNFIHEHAQTLVSYLTSFRKRRKSQRNPIIWVAHSLGGILLKRVLEHSDHVRASAHEDDRAIYVSTYAIVFLGTPHEGSDLARWGEVLQGMVGRVPRRLFDSEPILIKTLRKDGETLANINANFINIQQRFKIHLVHENQKTDLKGTMSLIVDSKSAAPKWYNTTSYGIEADHSGMCKFASVDAPGYRQITSVMTDWVKESPEVIMYRWQVEDQDRRIRAQVELNERARPFIENSAAGSSQIVGTFSSPQVMSPVTDGGSPAQLQHGEEETYTVGEKESSLKGLVSPNGTALTTQRLPSGPPSPLPMLPMIPPSQPVTQESMRTEGSGSQASKEPYHMVPEGFRPNSYFVGREQELKELHRMLQDKKVREKGTSTVLVRCQTGGGKTHMAREYLFRHQHDYSGGVFWLRASSVQELEGEFSRIAKIALKDLRAKIDRKELEDHTKMVDHVRGWLEDLDDWLLVLDGIMFDQDNGIERFFPYHANTSMILLSTSTAGAGSHVYNNPRPLQLPPLSTQEAQRLLLEEMEKEKPWSHDDLAQAAELVHILEKLPLMIHIIAQHLKSSQEPLSTYLRRYKAKPPHLGKVPAYELVLEQMEARGALGALNVLCILAFLDQHIPVEMLSVGLRVLDNKSTPYKTRHAVTHGGANLNNTLRILIAYALVDRSDKYNLSRSSSATSKGSFELTDDIMDTLHIHRIVQRYLIESLVQEKQHIYWLERSVEVFCKAYKDADARIKERTSVGLPDDYRRFALHCRKLIGHLSHYEDRYRATLRPIREQMEDQLKAIEAEVQRLSEKIQADMVNQANWASPTSVFDKVKSLSDSDTGTTDSQPPSQQVWTPAEEGQTGFFDSPVDERFPTRYTNPEVVVPYPVDDDGGDGDNTPTPQITPKPPSSQLAMPIPEQPPGRRRASSSSGNRPLDFLSRWFNKENIPLVGRRRKSSASSSSRPEPQVPTSTRTSPGTEYTAMMPSVPPIIPRSARSSPGTIAAPFSPPSLPGVRSSIPPPRQHPPPRLQQWKSTPYQPRPYLGRVESSSLGQQNSDPALHGYPPILTTTPPASRGSSRPPNKNIRGRRSDVSVHSGMGVRGTAERSRRGSSPLSSPVGSIPPGSRRRSNNNLSGPRSSSSSIATMPSPRINPRPDAAELPYPVGTILSPTRPPQGSAGSIRAPGPAAFVNMPVPSVPAPPPPPPARPVRRESRRERLTRLLTGSRRAQSESPAEGLPAGREASGEEMMRSASGGIVVGEGSNRQVIHFGDLTVNMGDAHNRLQDRRRLQGPRTQGEAAMERSGTGDVGLGIMPQRE